MGDFETHPLMAKQTQDSMEKLRTIFEGLNELSRQLMATVDPFQV